MESNDICLFVRAIPIMDERAIVNKRSLVAVESLEFRRLLTKLAPDLTFGNDGSLLTSAHVLLTALPNGEILAAGGGVSELKPDGMPDPSLGNGIAFIDFTIDKAAVTKKHIFLYGESTQDPRPQRLLVFNLSDGSRDAAFGRDGKEPIPFEQPGDGLAVNGFAVSSMAVTADGGVLLSVQLQLSNSTSQSQIVKIEPDGSVDSSFADHGYLPIPGQNLMVQGYWTTNGVVVTTDDADGNAKLFGYNQDGSPDTTFGNQGSVAAGSIFGPKLVEEPDGRLLLYGESSDASEDAQVTRFNVNGSIDQMFGTNGTAILNDADATAPVQPLAVDSSNRILVLTDNNLYRLTSGGQLDTTFNDTGSYGQPLESAATLAVDSNDRPLVGSNRIVSRFDSPVPVSLGADGIVHVYGTTGDDTITATLASATIHVSLNGQDNTFADMDVNGFSIIAGDGNNDITIGVDKNATIITGSDNDTIITSGGDDSIFSGGGQDSIISGSGNDTVSSGEGNSFISVGDGDDSVTCGSGMLTISAGNGNDTIDCDGWLKQFTGGATGFKRITLDGGGNNIDLGSGGSTITDLGPSGNNNITIAGGNNTIDLNGDNTNINTVFIAGVGKNTISVGMGTNTITTGDGDDTIHTQGNDSITTNGGDDLIFGVNSGLTRTCIVNSGAGNDTIATGDASADINAGEGNDLIKTGNQNDTILGGGGKDTIHAGGGDDYISGGGGKDRIFGQDGDDTIIGGGGNDVLYGGAGLNVLSGQGGSDALFGNIHDTLNDGAGDDAVSFFAQ
jgi:uncharacterized delta-60 repeat protein